MKSGTFVFMDTYVKIRSHSKFKISFAFTLGVVRHYFRIQASHFVGMYVRR
jgi:hypothetical protein